MTLDGTGLARETYRDHVTVDAARIAELADDDPTRPVPWCPGWTLTDLAAHVGDVFAHKVAAVQLGREPEDDERAPRPDADAAVPAWLREQCDALIAVVFAADPAAPAWTWWPPEQTCGFWQRRMAQECLVHRLDAESAVGEVGPVDAALAVDGCDEIVGWLAWDWTGVPQPEAAGQVVRLVAAGHAWTVELHPEDVRVAGASSGVLPRADWEVSAAPADLLRWLWGRPVPDDRVQVGGDPLAVRLLRDRLSMATS